MPELLDEFEEFDEFEDFELLPALEPAELDCDPLEAWRLAVVPEFEAAVPDEVLLDTFPACEWSVVVAA